MTADGGGYTDFIGSQQPCGACGTCDAGIFCPRAGLAEEEARALAGIIRQAGPFAPGERIDRVGDSFRSIFAIQSGAVKSEVSTRDGRTEVTGARWDDGNEHFLENGQVVAGNPKIIADMLRTIKRQQQG